MSKSKTSDLEKIYMDAIQDAFQVVQEEYETEAGERLTSQIEALRTCLADCRAYQEELEEDAAIECYGNDLPDDIVPKELNNAAA